MLTEDYIVRMIRDMGRMLARVLGSDALEPERAVELWTDRAGDCPPLLEELKALCDRGTSTRRRTVSLRRQIFPTLARLLLFWPSTSI